MKSGVAQASASYGYKVATVRAEARAYLLNFTARICTKGQRQQAQAVGYERESTHRDREREGE